MDNVKSDIKADCKTKKPPARKPWKWPKGKPRRPKSAYNFFFRQERQKLLQDMSSKRKCPRNNSNKSRKKNGLGFSALAKNIAVKWKQLSDEEKAEFQAHADKDTARYQLEIAAWQTRSQGNEKHVPEPREKQSESTPSNKDTYSQMVNSIESMSKLIEQSIMTLTQAIMTSQQQVLLLSAQQDISCISPTASDEHNSFPRARLSEVNSNAMLWQPHPSSMNYQETSNSLQAINEETYLSVDTGGTDSLVFGQKDNGKSPDNDTPDNDILDVDDDISTLFEELDSF